MIDDILDGFIIIPVGWSDRVSTVIKILVNNHVRDLCQTPRKHASKTKGISFRRVVEKWSWVNEFQGYAFLFREVILLRGYLSINIKEKG